MSYAGIQLRGDIGDGQNDIHRRFFMLILAPAVRSPGASDTPEELVEYGGERDPFDITQSEVARAMAQRCRLDENRVHRHRVASSPIEECSLPLKPACFRIDFDAFFQESAVLHMRYSCLNLSWLISGFGWLEFCVAPRFLSL